jgi:hypothetical protein
MRCSPRQALPAPCRSSSPHWPPLRGILGGKFLYRRRDAAQDSLTIAQREVQVATAEEIHARIERDERAAALSELRERVADLKADLQGARAAREVELARVRLLEEQNEKLQAQHKCDQAEVGELKARLNERE